MNNTLDPTQIQEYLGELPLDHERQQALAHRLEEEGGDLATLHRALHEEGLVAAEPLEETREMLDSVPARLALGWPDALERGCRIVQDHQGRPTIDSTPPIRRTRMVPEPWQTNILDRGWRRLKGEKPAPRPRTRESEDFAEERWRHVAAVRRAALLVLMITQTVVATWYMKSVLPYQGWSLVDLGLVFEQPWQESARQILPYVVQTSILALFALLFCWVSMGFWTALMGFFQLLKGHDRYSISATSCGDEPISPRARTALVMPIANEHVPRVFAGLRATFESLKATGQLDHFDFFVLSDSNDPDICVAEQQAWMELCREVEGFGHIFYRRRRRRVKRKSGNIDDFCRRWGSNYRYMVVLDADSVMSGECLTRLVRLMEANPGAGIIQTAPKASGMDTLYARLQQFATSVYGPLFTAGLNFWQLGESHYWGHNAIIRVKPFIEHCALAPLPGTGSFAGAILSHDFVEAALMRRAGWGVWIAYDLPGSYEELPRQPDELPFVPGAWHACRASRGVSHRGHVLPVRAAVVVVPGALDLPAGDSYADGAGVLPAAQPALSTLAALAATRGHRPVLGDHDPAVPAQAAQRAADLDQGCRGLRWAHAGAVVDAAGGVLLGAAGAGAHAVPQSVRHRRLPRLVGAVELAAARG
jgi:membrane glycosyltransferase